MLDESGKAKLTDFGLARTMISTSHSESPIAGSAPWMAPEQIDPVFGSVDHRTDVYGLGALLFTLLTGHPPFEATRIPDVLAQIVSQSPVPPSHLRSGISPHLDEMCLRCLTKLPERRIASVADFLRSIESFSPENPQNQKI